MRLLLLSRCLGFHRFHRVNKQSLFLSEFGYNPFVVAIEVGNVVLFSCTGGLVGELIQDVSVICKEC